MTRGAVVPPLTSIEQERFWAQTRGTEGGCLEWTGQRNGPRGTSYGLFAIKREGSVTRLMAHRVALALSTGVADGFFACHHCDNPPCVDPAHLYWGTPTSNMQDALERNPGKKLGATRRPDTTRRHVGRIHELGQEVALIRSDEMAGWMAEHRADIASEVRRYGDRLVHGDRLPELIA